MTNVDACTIFEGDYHLGAAALLNSLHAGGFRGRFWAAHRGPQPGWLTGAGDRVDLGGIDVRPVPLPSDWRVGQQKPYLMRHVLRDRQPDAAGLCYFDPDVVCQAPWTFFQDWVDVGVAVCEDCTYARMPATHPFRSRWRALIAGMGRRVAREVDSYVNSGFVGVARGHLPFLDAWAEVVDAIGSAPWTGVDLTRLTTGTRLGPFYSTDQDALNITVMATDMPVSVIGPDGMGFTPGGFVMHHAVGWPKPWRGRYTWRLLRYGGGPGPADKLFWRHARGVANPLSAARLAAARADRVLATALSRIYGH